MTAGEKDEIMAWAREIKNLDVHTGNEIEHLANCFNSMTDELKTQMANLAKETAKSERIATELTVAANIQQSMLPKDSCMLGIDEDVPFPQKKITLSKGDRIFLYTA